jgi:uncharacterized membrane protein
MRSIATIFLVLVSLSAAAQPDASLSARPAYAYTTIDVPNAAGTTAFGISDSRFVVGLFTDSSGRQHGFRVRGDSVDVIDYPGAIVTSARGIAPNGDIVGLYRNAGEPAVNAHGFLLTNSGEFRAVDYPNHLNTIAQRVLANGAILGCYHERDLMASMHGVVMAPDGRSEIPETASMHNGATPDLSVIVGSYTDMMTNQAHAYAIVDGNFNAFDYPNAKSTGAWDINPAGTMVGFFTDAAGRVHGFVVDGDAFAPIDFPGAVDTRAYGINAAGDITGNYLDTGKKLHAFIARHVIHAPARETEHAAK